MSWIRVTKQSPCLACNHTDWCMNGDDGQSALCMRMASSRPYPMKSGETAYIHKFTTFTHTKPVRVNNKRKIKYINAEQIFSGAISTTTGEQLDSFAESIGVEPHALIRIGCAWFHEHNAWGFPMKDGVGRIVGIRLRCPTTGRKWAVTGSQSGIFQPFGMPSRRMCICEGPTDTAAALSCGLFAVGRPSCGSGVNEILRLLRWMPTIREAVILSDNDEVKVRKDGSKFWPGQEGAAALQSHLTVKSCVLTLPCKDMRAFYRLGGNEGMIDDLIGETLWVNPERVDT